MINIGWTVWSDSVASFFQVTGLRRLAANRSRRFNDTVCAAAVSSDGVAVVAPLAFTYDTIATNIDDRAVGRCSVIVRTKEQQRVATFTD